MANFPIPLLSDRKPYTGSAIAPHARMANFPLPLIKRRREFIGSGPGAHRRVTQAFLPTVISSGDAAKEANFKKSVSEFFGVPTILRR